MSDENDENGEHPLKGIFARLLSAAVGNDDSEERRAYRGRLYLANKRRELAEMADIRGVPCDAGIREPALNAHLAWPGVAAIREVLGDRAERERARVRRSGRIPALAMLGGETGTGKTTAISWAVTHAERPALYTTAEEIASTKRWGDGLALWLKWERADTLAIDELGVESDPAVISKLLLHRWDNAGGFTCCATNLTLTEVMSRYLARGLGERLVDRFSDQGVEWWHVVAGLTRAERRAQGGGR